jgi:hypothetical protein
MLQSLPKFDGFVVIARYIIMGKEYEINMDPSLEVLDSSWHKFLAITSYLHFVIA